MTSNDISTPKKAEDATLLERLDTRIRELQEYRGIYTQAVQQTELVYQDQGLLEDQLDDQAREYIALLSEVRDELRAQAEADKGLRKALAHYAELRHYDHAGRLWSGDPDEHEDAQVDFGEIARAALAQAGGEG